MVLNFFIKLSEPHRIELTSYFLSIRFRYYLYQPVIKHRQNTSHTNSVINSKRMDKARNYFCTRPVFFCRFPAGLPEGIIKLRAHNFCIPQDEFHQSTLKCPVRFLQNTLVIYSSLDLIPRVTRICEIQTDWLTNQQTNQLNSLDEAESFFQTPTDPQLLKKFPAYYGNREFITAFTTACQLSMSWARSIPATPSLPTLKGSF